MLQNAVFTRAVFRGNRKNGRRNRWSEKFMIYMGVRLSDGHLAAFRLGQYRVNDHPYYAPQFSVMDPSLEQIN